MVLVPSENVVFTSAEINAACWADPKTSMQKALYAAHSQLSFNDVVEPNSACSLESYREVRQISVSQDGAISVVFNLTQTFSLSIEDAGLDEECLTIAKKLILELAAKQRRDAKRVS